MQSIPERRIMSSGGEQAHGAVGGPCSVAGRQRQGIGRILLRHLANQAHGAGWRELEIVAEPLAAEFYHRCGAQQAGEEVSSEGLLLPVFLLTL